MIVDSRPGFDGEDPFGDRIDCRAGVAAPVPVSPVDTSGGNAAIAAAFDFNSSMTVSILSPRLTELVSSSSLRRLPKVLPADAARLRAGHARLGLVERIAFLGREPVLVFERRMSRSIFARCPLAAPRAR